MPTPWEIENEEIQRRISAYKRLQAINADLLAALEAVSDELEGFDGISAGGRKVHFSASARQALKVGRAAIAKARKE